MNNNTRLIAAAKKGDAQEVRRLIPVSDPLYKDSEALWQAVFHEHVECVRLLAPVSDVKDEHSVVLQIASMHRNQIIFDILYPWSDPHDALEDMINDGDSEEERFMLQTRIQADRERDIIQSQLGDTKSGQRSKKM